jgi:hypothetical protein
MVKKHYDRDFEFYCITDNPSGIRSEVLTRDLDRLSEFRGTSENMFTIEKLSSFKEGFLDCNGPYVRLFQNY